MANEKFAAEILAMADRDQAMRRAVTSGDATSEWEVDRANTARLGAIIEEIGWPTRSRVGDAAEHAAWLLAQHADHDVPLQRRCLELMRAEPEAEVCLRHLAYLEDRIAVHENRPQRFGTQLAGSAEDGYRAGALADPEHVDELRRSMGLEPLAEYVARAAQLFATGGSARPR